MSTYPEKGFIADKRRGYEPRLTHGDKNMLYEMKNTLTNEVIYFKHFTSCLRFSKMNPCTFIVSNMKTGRKYWIKGINAQTYKLEIYNGITA